MSAIHEAVRNGDLLEVKRLVDAGCALESYDEVGHTPLMTACLAAGAAVEVMGYLLDCGADVNGLARDPFADQRERTPLPDVDAFGVQGIKPELGGIFDEMPEFIESLRTMRERIQEMAPEHRSVLSVAVDGASVEKLRLLLERGADPGFRSAAGYTPVILAACAGRMDVIELLVAAGAPVDGETSYGESAINVFSRTGQFEQVARLLELGADPAPLQWTPLHRAAALGTLEEVEALLDAGVELEPLDSWERTPLLVAIHAGKIGNAALLLERGANRFATGRCGKTVMHYAVDRDDAAMLQWLVAQGYSPEAVDGFEETALRQAVEAGALACFEALLDAGADWRRLDRFHKPLIAEASHPGIVRRLLDLGQSAAALAPEVLRNWIGLGNCDGLPVTMEEFHAGRSRRFGAANPEQMDVPFWNAMVRNGWDAAKAARQFGHDSFGLNDPVWCHARFGMSLTPLLDGRWVQVAGEHEDSYDPDFCIYNDVIVHDGHGGFQIFGYPREIFPPTDFHSATHAGDWIYLIGNLSYVETRRASAYQTQVFRLHIGDWHIERVETHGESPGWIHGHQAVLDGDLIRVSHGKRYSPDSEGNEVAEELAGTYELNLTSGSWQRR